MPNRQTHVASDRISDCCVARNQHHHPRVAGIVPPSPVSPSIAKVPISWLGRTTLRGATKHLVNDTTRATSGTAPPHSLPCYVFISSARCRIIRTISLSEAKLKSTTGRPTRITQECLAYIEKLELSQAGRLQPSEGETVAAIRRRLGAAAKLFGQPVTIKRVGDEVFFWLGGQTTRRRRRKSQ